jgi:hypothetical protein
VNEAHISGSMRTAAATMHPLAGTSVSPVSKDDTVAALFR